MHFLQQRLITTLTPQIQTIRHHSLFQALSSLSKLRSFAEIHVFALWSTMCFAKALQRQFSSSHPLWLPPQNHDACQLFHEIVLQTECMQRPGKPLISALEWYIEAMDAFGANISPIQQLLHCVEHHVPLSLILEQKELPVIAKDLIRATFNLMQYPLNGKVSAFVYGFYPNLAEQIELALENLTPKSPSLDSFKRYVEYERQRHVRAEYPRFEAIITRLCGNSPDQWEEATQAAQIALSAQIKAFDQLRRSLKRSG